MDAQLTNYLINQASGVVIAYLLIPRVELRLDVLIEEVTKLTKEIAAVGKLGSELNG